jgi:glycosyltransferase involved in cell wall biosynthesis
MNTKVLITGFYNRNYPRNSVLVESMKKVFDVVEKEIMPNKNTFSFLKIIKTLKEQYKYVFIVNSNYKIFFLFLYLKLFTKNIIIYDAYLSFYENIITDRNRFSKFSLASLFFYLLDYIIVYFSDILIFDTKEHQDYFKENYKIKKQTKLLVWPVSLDVKKIDKYLNYDSDDSLFYKDKYNILFYGTYIPLQGIEYIIKAANFLKTKENLMFTLIGDGYKKKEIKELVKEYNLTNIKFINLVTYEKLFSYIKQADLCLGIFGDTDKAKRVIPNKVLECLSAKKIVITGRNNALERYFESNNDIVYCELANEKDIVRKIQEVYKNYEQYKRLGYNGREKIERSFSTKALKDKIIRNLYEL